MYKPKRFREKTTTSENNFTKVAAQKTSRQKSVAFLYTMDNLSRKLENNSIYYGTKRDRTLRKKLVKDIKDVYTENYKVF